MKIRYYQKEDLKEVTNFIIKNYRETFHKYPRLHDLDNLKNFYIFFLVAEQNKKIIGTTALIRINRRTGEIKRMFVKKSFRRKGLGKKLLNNIINKAKKLGIVKIKLYTSTFNLPAVSFYQKMGFKQTKSYNQGAKSGRTYLRMYLK